MEKEPSKRYHLRIAPVRIVGSCEGNLDNLAGVQIHLMTDSTIIILKRIALPKAHPPDSEIVPLCRFFFAVDAEFPVEVLPQGVGLIIADRCGAEIVVRKRLKID